MRIEVYHRLDPALESLLERAVSLLSKKMENIMATLDQLTADVTADTNAVNSAVTLLQNLTTAIKSAGTDPVALKALTDQLETNTAALAAAVTANTPSA